jgi:membrane-associated phospholipid phosphatase
MTRALAVTAVALVLWTVVVIAGGTTTLDDWAVNHVMPGVRFGSGSGLVTLTGLWRPFPLDAVWWDKILVACLYPASFLVSLLAVVTASAVVARRGRPLAAALWVGAWIGANALELVGKVALERPGITWIDAGRPTQMSSFDHSYPSGHSARGIVLAALVAYLYPRTGPVAAAWVVLMTAALVVAGDHTVSDVVGGALVGSLLVLAVHAISRMHQVDCRPTARARWRRSPPAVDAAGSDPRS